MKTEMLKVRKPKLPASRSTPTTKKSGRFLQIQNILVPLDFSPASHAAIRFALPLLNRLRANLHLIHVLPSDSPASGLADLPMVVPDVEIARRVQVELGKVAHNNGVQIQEGNLHTRRGTPFAEICALARNKKIDLIVIATRGITGLKHVLLGSTAERVVRYSPCPVLVVHARDAKKNGSRNGLKTPWAIGKILVPVDFSDPSARNLAYAKQLAKEFDATLILLHSVALKYYVTSDEYARYDFPLLMQQAEKAAKRQMRDLVAQTKRDGLRVEPSLQIGHAGEQICERAVAEHADLIVTSTHGRTGLKHVLIGSTAEYVVRHAKTPVLVVPSHDRPIPL